MKPTTCLSKSSFILALFCLWSFTLLAQQNVGIGTLTPDSSAILDLSSTNKGLLLPRMTKAQRNAITNPKAGLSIFQTDSAPGIYIYDGSVWLISLLGRTNTISAVNGSQTFNYTGSSQSFVVPAGITSITFELYGAQGGAGKYVNTDYDEGGAGGKTTGRLTVMPGETIYVFVGGKPATAHNSNGGGYNGGGTGITLSGQSGQITTGAGGGATDLRRNGTALANRIAVAGGGGGVSLNFYQVNRATGGVGGGNTGGVGTVVSGFNAGTPTGGSQSAGGNAINGNNGTLGVGGNSPVVWPDSSTAGAGGGGYYGGAASKNAPSTGGSGFVDAEVQSGVLSSGINNGNGYAIISWAEPLRIEIEAAQPSGSTQVHAGANTSGILSSTDWNTFNNKSSVPALNSGSLVFSNGTTLSQNNTHLYWDNNTTNMRLGGANTLGLSAKLAVNGIGGLKVFTTNTSGSTDWIAGAFGGSATDNALHRVVLGTLDGKATIGGHNSILNSWADLILSPGGNVGIGTTAPSSKLTVNGGVYATAFQLPTGALTGKVLMSSNNSGNATWADLPSTTLVNAAGGIKVFSTNSSSYNDWIAGTFGGAYNNTSIDRVVMGTANGKATIAGHNGGLTAWADLIISPEAGSNVGIGTTTPSTKLHVNGTIRSTGFMLTNGAAAGSYLTSDASGNASWTTVSNAGASQTGFLTSTDWNTFNNKASSTALNAKADSSVTLSVSGPLTGGGSLGASRTIGITQASAGTDGYLSATDWSTFNSKASSVSMSSKADSAVTISTSGPLSGGGNLSANRSLSITQANTTTDGYLSSADWNTFNNKFNLPNLTSGSLLFSNGSAIGQNNSKLFWRDSTQQLAIGTNQTNGTLTVNSRVLGTGTTNSLGDFTGTSDWIAGNFGGPSGDRLVMGNLNGDAALGAINNNLNQWKNLHVYGYVTMRQLAMPTYIPDKKWKMVIDANGTISRAGEDNEGTVTDVNVNHPLTVENRFSAPIIEIKKASATEDGYLSKEDWNTFNNKLNSAGNANSTTNGFLTSTDWTIFNSKASASSVMAKADTNINITTSGPLNGGGNLSANRTLSISQANTTTDGYLSNTDWNTFNNKVSNAALDTKSDTNITFSVSGPLTGGGSLGASRTIGITQATGSTSGYLSATDWSTFNNKFSLPSLTSGSILFSNGSTVTQNNAQLFWDQTNNRMGIGTVTPVKKLEVKGTGGLIVSSTNNGSGTTDWIAGNFGSSSDSARVIMGNLFGKATIGSHNVALNAWAPLYIQQVGNTVIGGDQIEANEKLVVEGNIKATGMVKQNSFNQLATINAGSVHTITWNHNLGYQPVLMISVEGANGHYCLTGYTHTSSNQIQINVNNTTGGSNTITVRWIVVN